jgi:hypothetical protein
VKFASLIVSKFNNHNLTCRGHLKEEVIRLSGVNPQKEKRRMRREMKKTEKVLKKQV